MWIDGSYKLVVEPGAGAAKLYDAHADPAHKTDLAAKMSEKVEAMRKALDDWRRGVRDSYDGKDYPAKK